MSNSKLIRVPLDERVWTSTLRKGAAISWPRIVDHRLDQLAALADKAGEKTNRAELAAAIVCAAPTDSTQLGKMLKRYRTVETRDVAIEVPKSAKTVDLRPHRPGPRKPSA